MAKFTLSQLDVKPDNYTILDTDLLLLTVGTNTPFLSSIKISAKQYADYLAADTLIWSDDGTNVTLATSTDKVGIGTATPNEVLTVAGNVSATGLVYADNVTVTGDVSARGVVYGTQYHVIPTTVADLGAAINSAFTQGFSAIQLQAGHYTMSTTVDIPKRHTVLGTGYRTTRIDFTTNNTAFRLSGEYIELGGMSIDFTNSATQHTKCGVQLGASTAPIGYASRCHVHDVEVFMAGNHGIDCDVATMCSFGNLATVSCSADGFHVNTAVDGCHANNSYGVIDTRGNRRDGFRITAAGNTSIANRWGPIVAQSNNRGGSSYHGGWEALSGNGVTVNGAVKNVFESIYGEQNEHGYTVGFASTSKLNDITILHSGGTGHGDHNVNVGIANIIHTHGAYGDSAGMRTVYGRGNSVFNPTLSGDFQVAGDVRIGPMGAGTNATTETLTVAGSISAQGDVYGNARTMTDPGQVLSVQSKSSGVLTAFTNTWVTIDSGLDITVTPKSSSSKFILQFTAPAGASSQRVYMRFVRDSTVVGSGAAAGSRLLVNGATYMGSGDFDQMAGSYLDSPATASEIVYHVQFYCNSGNGYINRSHEDSDGVGSVRGTANFTMTEIAG